MMQTSLSPQLFVPHGFPVTKDLTAHCPVVVSHMPVVQPSSKQIFPASIMCVHVPAATPQHTGDPQEFALQHTSSVHALPSSQS